jgi:hypothetical protein
VLSCLNSGGALLRLVRSRWISLVAVQCVLLWSIPKTGADFPQSDSAAIILSQPVSQALMQSAVEFYFIQETSNGSDEVQGNLKGPTPAAPPAR